MSSIRTRLHVAQPATTTASNAEPHTHRLRGLVRAIVATCSLVIVLLVMTQASAPKASVTHPEKRAIACGGIPIGC